MRKFRSLVRAAVGIGMVSVAVAAWIGADQAAGSPDPARREATAEAARAGSREQILNAYANLPVTFVENQGQIDPRARYYAQGRGYAFYLTNEEIVLAFAKVSDGPDPMRTSTASSKALGSSLEASSSNSGPVVAAATTEASPGVALALRFVDGNKQAVAEAAAPAPGTVTYLRGNDPARWRTELPQYAEIVYRELWPNVDLRLHGQGGTLKYEFRVRPGAQLSNIRMAYAGAAGLALDDSGGLSIATELGILRDAAPLSYQEIAGTRVPVESHYTLSAGSEPSYGFAVGAYDPERELIIDPGLAYSTFLGGTTGQDSATGIAVDAAGNAYIVGTTQSTDYPTTPGAFDRSFAGPTEVFVSKLNPTGTALVYSTFVGGIGGSGRFDSGRAIAVDAGGNAYVTGQTNSVDFPTKNAFQPKLTVNFFDQHDAFVFKLNPAGSGLVYSTFLGGADVDDGLGIAVDGAGNAYVTGQTGSVNFPTTAGAFKRTASGAFDAFVAKLGPTGSTLVYSTLLGGSQVDYGKRVAVDAAGNAYVMGATSSPNFPTTAGAFKTSFGGAFDIFVTKLNPAGSALVYSTFLGGSNSDIGGGLAIDASGNAYVSGATISADFPTTPGAFDVFFKGNNAFVTKLNAAGSGLVYSTFVGGTGSDGASAIALDAAGNAWITGTTTSPDFPITPGTFDSVYHGPVGSGIADAFVAELSAAGSALLYSTFLGGSSVDVGSDIAVDPAGNVYVAGQTNSAEFPTTPGAFNSVFKGGGGDAFVVKFAQGTSVPVATLSGVAVSPASVTGGTATTGTVTLTAAAPSGGATVTLSSSTASAASVPASVTIPAGVMSATFAVTTSSVAASTIVTITAAYNGATQAATLAVGPTAAPASLQILTLNPTIAAGGATSQGTVTLTSAAPASGVTVALSSSQAAAVVPQSVSVVSGATSAIFAITTNPVAASTPVTITASAGGVTRTAVLMVTPAAQAATLTMTATGRNGERVTSSPAGINVAVGSSTSASFATGTAVTLTASNGRSAVWSGACSSGGSKTKTCTFNLATNATVTANVQ